MKSASVLPVILLVAPALASATLRIYVRTPDGMLGGVVSAKGKVHAFKGVPFAAPPVGELRWRAPQPVVPWTGVREAVEFGSRCMQGNIYGDMVFRDHGPSEDCLYLNVWAPATSAKEKLPVMVWIYGGGFGAGATSEPRQDGENLSKKGVVVVSMNYRLGVFGFFSHSDLAKESGHEASGNYGLLDQVAALQWVHRNIGLFGGNPDNVTIFGESAGSFSVSALMASPLARGLIHRAIGESGAFFAGTLATKTLAESEAADLKFAESALGTTSLEELRAKPADLVLKAALKQDPVRFAPNVDGYFLPKDVHSIFARGEQSHVPLLAGWNADEGSYHAIFGKEAATARNYPSRLRALYGDRADELLKVYPGETDAQAVRSAQDLAGDQFIAFSTWRWLEMQLATGGSRVFRYEFDDAPPAVEGSKDESRGAYHSAEIEFVFGMLSSKPLPWRPNDYKLSDLMSTYWSNFAKTGDPNGPGLPEWPAYNKDGYQVMHLGAASKAEPDRNRARYELLNRPAPVKTAQR